MKPIHERAYRPCYESYKMCAHLVSEGWSCNLGICDPDSREYDRFITPCEYHMYPDELLECVEEHNRKEKEQ